MKTKLFFILMLTALISGCGGTRTVAIRYPLNKDIYHSNVVVGKNVVIDIFEDKRSMAEREGMAKIEGMHLYTSDEWFGPDIPRQISDLLAKHLESAGLFQGIRVKDVPNDLEDDPTAKRSLKDQGVDFVITGTLKHLYGFQSGSAGPSILFGPLGVIIELLVNPKDEGAIVEYEDLKIIDLKNNEVLWQGNIKHDYQVRVRWYYSPTLRATWGLREANNKLAKKLEEVLNR